MIALEVGPEPAGRAGVRQYWANAKGGGRKGEQRIDRIHELQEPLGKASAKACTASCAFAAEGDQHNELCDRHYWHHSAMGTKGSCNSQVDFIHCESMTFGAHWPREGTGNDGRFGCNNVFPRGLGEQGAPHASNAGVIPELGQEECIVPALARGCVYLSALELELTRKHMRQGRRWQVTANS